MELELATSNSTLVPPPVSSGLYYYGYRFYSPNLGRWISRDPIREQGGRNLYNFVGNDGVDRWDLLGKISGLTPGEVVASGGVDVTGCMIVGPGAGVKVCLSGSIEVEGGACCKKNKQIASVVKITGSLSASLGVAIGIPEPLKISPKNNINYTFKKNEACPSEVDEANLTLGIEVSAGPTQGSCSIVIAGSGEASCDFGFTFGLDVSASVFLRGKYSVITVK